MIRLRIKIVIAVAAIMLILLPVLCFAHSGRTDEYGGHWDNIHGGYHYHHGFPAHQHPNGKCPYLQQQDDNVADSQQSAEETPSTDFKIDLSENAEPIDPAEIGDYFHAETYDTSWLDEAKDKQAQLAQLAKMQNQTQSKEVKHESATGEDFAVAAITTVIIFIIILILLRKMTR